MDAARRTLGGRYELAEVLGRGGMGVVYRATDLVLHRTVAVKVLPAALAEEQPTHVARFEREARAAASLSHPSVVAVYDTGAQEGTRFIVMEYVSGHSLATVLQDRDPLDPTRAAGIAERVADALAAAHDAGLIHRDVKPGNVMLAADGSVKVLDFGIARALDSTTLTREATVLGSAAYMAPEQALGERADERSDIYSLGCLLYAMLTGRPPFGGDAVAALLHQHINADPRPPSETNPGVWPALEELTIEMLAKSPLSRPQTATEVRDRLAIPPPAAAGATAPTLHETTAVTRVLSTAARSPHRRTIAAAVSLGLALLIAVILALADRGPSSRPSSKVLNRLSGSHKTQTQTSANTSHPATTATTTPTAASSQPRAPSIAAIAGGITTLVTQAVESGKIDQQAAQQITSRLSDILGSYEMGNATDAQHKLADLSHAITMLESHTDISPPAATTLGAALTNLAVALARSAPATSPQAQEVPPGPAQAPPSDGGPPGHGGEPPGQAKKHADSNGD